MYTKIFQQSNIIHWWHWKICQQSKTSVAPPTTFPYCQKHAEEQLKLDCQYCEVLVCCDCVLVQRKYHNYNFVDEDEKEHLKMSLCKSWIKSWPVLQKPLLKLNRCKQRFIHPMSSIYIAQLCKKFKEIANMMAKTQKVPFRWNQSDH